MAHPEDSEKLLVRQDEAWLSDNLQPTTYIPQQTASKIAAGGVWYCTYFTLAYILYYSIKCMQGGPTTLILKFCGIGNKGKSFLSSPHSKHSVFAKFADC